LLKTSDKEKDLKGIQRKYTHYLQRNKEWLNTSAKKIFKKVQHVQIPETTKQNSQLKIMPSKNKFQRWKPKDEYWKGERLQCHQTYIKETPKEIFQPKEQWPLPPKKEQWPYMQIWIYIYKFKNPEKVRIQVNKDFK
jgi:hypothetical protein